MTDAVTTDAVRVTVEVGAAIERAFTVFAAEFATWWPTQHHLSPSGLDTVVLEPGVGGRWYERGLDGTECNWGRVLAWDPPNFLALSWQLGPDWEAGVPEAMASRVEVRFVEVEPGRTMVELVHGGLANHGAGWERIRDGVNATGGWSGILDGYARRVGE